MISFRYLFHFGTATSLVTIALFQIERLLVMFSPIHQKHIIKMRCRRALICLPPVIFVSLVPVLFIYHLTLNAPSLPCFFELPGVLMAESTYDSKKSVANIVKIVMTYIYLVELGLYMCIPVVVLPVCSMLLPRRVNHIMSNSRRLKNPAEFFEENNPQSRPRGAKMRRQRTQVRVTRELVLISIFTTACLSPNLWWIPYGLSMYNSIQLAFCQYLMCILLREIANFLVNILLFNN